MKNLKKIDRVVRRHHWTSLAEWAECIRCLGDLSDDEIRLLSRLN